MEERDRPRKWDPTEGISRKGFAEVLLKLDEDEGKLRQELLDEVRITETTLKRVVRDAKKGNLIRLSDHRKPSDHGGAHRYVLTRHGKRVKEKILEMGIGDTISTIITAQETLDNQKDELEAWVDENMPKSLHEEYKQDMAKKYEPGKDDYIAR